MKRLTFPKLTLERHENVWVVRDDLFPYGSKARFLNDYFAKLTGLGFKEVVYGSSPRWGFAQISIAYLAKHYGMRCMLFIADGKLTPYTMEAKRLGAKVWRIPVGFLSVCERHAWDYAKNREEEGTILLPIGLDIPEAERGIVRVAEEIQKRLPEPDEVWTVASSGVLTRGLQLVWPCANFYAVQVGKVLSQHAAGRAKIIPHNQPFSKPAKILPPFPSVPEYDAKAWQYIPKDGKKVRLFWNVGATPSAK